MLLGERRVALGVSLRANSGLDCRQTFRQISGLDQLAGSCGGADEGAVASDRVLKGQRLDGRGLKEALSTLDCP